jgi:hypothetical protein
MPLLLPCLHRTRRLVALFPLGLALAWPASHALAQAQGPAAAPPGTKAGAPTAYRLIAWDELVPKDWDPMKDFKGLSLGQLQDSDPEAAKLLKRMRAAWDNAPANRALAGAAVKVPGYLVPLEENAAGLKEFLLVPYFGACIHSPPPPANQIIHVRLQTPAPGLRAMDTVWVSGTLSLARSQSDMGVSGYQMQGVKVEPYVEKPAP